MANIALPKSAPGDSIRGPLRVRTTAVLRAPTVEVLADTPASRRLLAPEVTTIAAPTVADLGRVRPPPAALLAETTVRARGRGARVAWFLSGLLAGALAVSATRGDMQSARAWGANALRSLKKNQTPATQLTQSGVFMTEGAPCDAEGDDPCEVLMAPFKDYPVTTATSLAMADIPTVNVEDLPRVARRVVWVPRPTPPTAAATEAPLVPEVSLAKPGDAKSADAPPTPSSTASAGAPSAGAASSSASPSSTATPSSTAASSAAPTATTPTPAPSSTSAPRAPPSERSMKEPLALSD